MPPARTGKAAELPSHSGLNGSQFPSKLFREPERRVETQVAFGLRAGYSPVILGNIVDPGTVAHRQQRSLRGGMDMDRRGPRRNLVPRPRPLKIAVAEQDARDTGGQTSRSSATIP